MKTETLRIKNFKGINKKADPTDIDQHECQTLDGFDTYKVPGALVKRKGYTDQADGTLLPASYPSSWTILNFFRFTVNKPSAKTITVVHATVSSVNKVFVDWTYSSGSWSHAWVELTEMEEALTMDAGSATTTVVDAGLSSSTNDYYNGWTLVNWNARQVSHVTDYVGATKTLTLAKTVAGGTGHAYCLYRFPLMVQLEYDGGWYTANTDSDTTQAFDVEDFDTEHYELRLDFDDAYNDWTLYNETRSTDATVSDYEANYAGSRRVLTHDSVASQVKTDEYALYKKTRVLTVDDKIQFHQRPNACIMKTGNTSRYPKQFPMWYGYIRDTYYFGDSSEDLAAGFYLEPATLDAPDDNCINDFTESAGETDPMTAGDYYPAVAYIYDGYQLGPLTSGAQAVTKTVEASGDYDLTLTIRCGFSEEPNMRSSKVLNKRVTGMAVFLSNDFDLAKGSGTFYRILDLPIRQDYNTGYGGTQPSLPGGINEKPRGLPVSSGFWTGFVDASKRRSYAPDG